ncbi:MAG: M20/M25/M40 family metallo-hydrolase [Solirubrobacteraceae bacterium]
MDSWVAESAQRIAARAERELEALVGVSSPSGDVPGAQECIAVCAALLPDAATIERPACSSPDHAPDLLARVAGTGSGRVLLLGHVDTVVAHGNHQPLRRDEGRLYGSGTVDMKGGVVLALGVLRALAARTELYAELALLVVCDEEWRTAPFRHAEAFAGWDACLCFEAGETTADGEDAVVVARKGAGTLHVRAHGRASHSGSAPDAGRNALLALAQVAQAVTTHHDPAGELRLTAVPTILNSGEAFNVVPGDGELYCDLRADDRSAFEAVLAAVPAELDEVRLESRLLRVWPGMDARAADAPVLDRAAASLGRPLHGHARGGASDASHFASWIPVTIDGLGPRGGAAHNPGEFVLARSLHERAEVALAVALAALSAP